MTSTERTAADHAVAASDASAPDSTMRPQSLITASLRAPIVAQTDFVACLAIIIIIGLRYTAEILALLFLVITLAILFAPLLRWLERKGAPSGPAIIVMLAGLIVFFAAFFLGYIPIVGLLIACVPALFLAFVQYGLGTALVALLLIILLNAAMDNFMTPHFRGDQLNMPTVFIMIGFLFWGWIYGPLGALLATPLTLHMRVLLESSQATRLHAGLMTSVDE